MLHARNRTDDAASRAARPVEPDLRLIAAAVALGLLVGALTAGDDAAAAEPPAASVVAAP
ncbi:MAG: hypothetical protein ACYTG1_06740 [Planctomycetota bacterium]